MTSVDTATVGVPTVCEFRPRKQVSSAGDNGTTARATAVSGLLYMRFIDPEGRGNKIIDMFWRQKIC